MQNFLKQIPQCNYLGRRIRRLQSLIPAIFSYKTSWKGFFFGGPQKDQPREAQTLRTEF